MNPSRRQVLFALAVLPACGPQAEPVAFAPWEPGGTEDLEAFKWGVQVGDVTAMGALVSVRTTESEVTVVVVTWTDSGWVEVMSQTGSPDDDVLQIEITGLAANQDHELVVWASDQARRSTITRFGTAPAVGSSRKIVFGATSCLGGNEPWPSLSHAATHELDVFLLLGDTIYADWGEASGFEKKWKTALRQQGFRDVCASTSLIATWDDHEVRNNYDPEAPGMAEEVDEAREAFRRALPSRSGPSGALWRSLSWGPVEFFVLDCRSERSGSDYVSGEQLTWLIDGLMASSARFKVILNSVPITDLSPIPIYGEIGESDRWQGYPAQRTELLQAIDDAGVTGVLFVSGDFHVGAIADISEVGTPGAGRFEVLAGPGGSPIHEDYSLVPVGGRFRAVVTQHNYTRFECDPDTGQVLVVYVGDDGAELLRLGIQV